MRTTLFITGASRGIGAAVLEHAPTSVAHAHTFSRKPSRGSWTLADLSSPSGWTAVRDAVTEALDGEKPDHAIFVHCAGTSDPIGRVDDLGEDEHAGAVLLNSGSGPVLGQAFLRACARRGVTATLVLVGSPAGSKDVPRMAHYCSGKGAMQHWARIAAMEAQTDGATRVITVVPYAVLTDVVRAIMGQEPDEVPLVDYFRQVESAGEFATPETAAQQIWAAIESAGNGAVVPVGSLVVADRATAGAATPGDQAMAGAS